MSKTATASNNGQVGPSGKPGIDRDGEVSPRTTKGIFYTHPSPAEIGRGALKESSHE